MGTWRGGLSRPKSRAKTWTPAGRAPGDVCPPHDALRRHKFAYRLTTADNGEDMLNMIARLDRDPAEGCPDLFLIDLNLPGRSGDEILARLRQSSRCSQIPAIVITSSDSSQDRARARDLGASYYFRKPADLEKQTHGVPSL